MPKRTRISGAPSKKQSHKQSKEEEDQLIEEDEEELEEDEEDDSEEGNLIHITFARVSRNGENNQIKIVRVA